MLIIGCDYHPDFQQIAWVDAETGGYGEQQLRHSDGEAERSYRNLKLHGSSSTSWNGGDRPRPLVRALAGRTPLGDLGG
jgi:hypothetical protein